jgi:DNA-binding transcriptional LysR family regulator
MKPFPLALAALVLSACGPKTESLRIGAGTDEPAPTIVSTVADTLRDAGFDVAVTFFDESDEMFARLSDQSLDLAVVEEPMRPVGRETTILPLYPSVLHVLSRANSPSSGLRELLGRAVYAGLPGSQGRRLAELLVDDLGVVGSQILDEPWGTIPEAYFIFGGLLSKDAIRQLNGFELVDLAMQGHGAGESIVDSIALRYPNLHPFTLPADLYPDLSREPVRTLAVTTLLAGRSGLREETVYRVTRQLIENLRPIRTMNPLARRISIENFDFDEFVLPLHTGSRRYLERNRPGFVEQHIDVIALSTTLFMAAVSGLVGWTHRRRRARKDRVDRHLINVLAVRRRIRAGQLDGAMETIDGIEKEVMQLVVTEQIEVDAGLIAFQLLCASVRREFDSAVA